MEKWEELITCDAANDKFGNFTVKSYGDWSVIISRIQKADKNQPQIITEILKEYGLEELEEEGKPELKPVEIGNFE